MPTKMSYRKYDYDKTTESEMSMVTVLPYASLNYPNNSCVRDNSDSLDETPRQDKRPIPKQRKCPKCTTETSSSTSLLSSSEDTPEQKKSKRSTLSKFMSPFRKPSNQTCPNSCDERQQRASQLKSKLTIKEHEVEDIRKSINLLEQRTPSGRCPYKSSRGDLEQIKARQSEVLSKSLVEKEELEKSCKSKAKELDELKNMYNNLKIENDERYSEIASLRTKLKNANDHIHFLKCKLFELVSSLKSHASVRDEALLRTLHTMQVESDRSIEELKQQLSFTKQSLVNLREKSQLSESLQRRVKDESDKWASLQVKLDAERKQHVLEIERLRSEHLRHITELKNSYNQLREQMEASNNKYLFEIDLLKEDHLKRLKGETEKVRLLQEKCEKTKMKTSFESTALNTELSKLQMEHRQILNDKGDVERQLFEAKAERSCLKYEISQRDMEILKLQDKVSEDTREMNRLKSAVKQTEKQCAELQATNNQLIESFNQVSQTCASFRKQVARVTRKFDISEIDTTQNSLHRKVFEDST